MSVILYKCQGSAPSRAVLMALEILGIKIDTKEVNVMAKENLSQEYLKKNHLHTVPLLEEGDFSIADSHVILTYLVAKNLDDDCKVYPKDIKIRATIDQRLYFESTVLTPKIIMVGKSLNQGLKAPNKEHVAEIETAYDFLEKYLQKTTFLATDYVTLADVSCVSSVSSLNIIWPIDGVKFPKLMGWLEGLSKEEWFQKVSASGLKIFGDYFRNLQNSINE